ncbi:hypothetical protein HDU96_008644 [Phlyctochytrium bullatum]|nr:hypothetical protein HDU96_008644 [Phlyctochytrium bullatum]
MGVKTEQQLDGDLDGDFDMTMLKQGETGCFLDQPASDGVPLDWLACGVDGDQMHALLALGSPSTNRTDTSSSVATLHSSHNQIPTSPLVELTLNAETLLSPTSASSHPSQAPLLVPDHSASFTFQSPSSVSPIIPAADTGRTPTLTPPHEEPSPPTSELSLQAMLDDLLPLTSEWADSLLVPFPVEAAGSDVADINLEDILYGKTAAYDPSKRPSVSQAYPQPVPAVHPPFNPTPSPIARSLSPAQPPAAPGQPLLSLLPAAPPAPVSLSKKQQRMARNREAAEQSRRRKREHVAELESRAQALETENLALRTRVAELEHENEGLRAALGAAAGSGDAPRTGTKRARIEKPRPLAGRGGEAVGAGNATPKSAGVMYMVVFFSLFIFLMPDRSLFAKYGTHVHGSSSWYASSLSIDVGFQLMPFHRSQSAGRIPINYALPEPSPNAASLTFSTGHHDTSLEKFEPLILTTARKADAGFEDGLFKHNITHVLHALSMSLEGSGHGSVGRQLRELLLDANVETAASEELAKPTPANAAALTGDRDEQRLTIASRPPRQTSQRRVPANRQRLPTTSDSVRASAGSPPAISGLPDGVIRYLESLQQTPASPRPGKTPPVAPMSPPASPFRSTETKGMDTPSRTGGTRVTPAPPALPPFPPCVCEAERPPRRPARGLVLSLVAGLGGGESAARWSGQEATALDPLTWSAADVRREVGRWESTEAEGRVSGVGEDQNKGLPVAKTPARFLRLDLEVVAAQIVCLRDEGKGIA